MAGDLGMSVPAVFAGSAILYLVMGLCSPFLARLFAKVGARPPDDAAFSPMAILEFAALSHRRIRIQPRYFQ